MTSLNPNLKKALSYERLMRRGAQFISWVFTPFSIPFLVFVLLFSFTYLRIMPLFYKLIVLGIISCFTILIPALSIYIFRRINRLKLAQLSSDKRFRYIPFLITLLCYIFCLQLMYKFSTPWYMSGVILSAIVIQCVCLVMNYWYKLSEHMAGVGGVIGGIVAFGTLFGYNPLGWLTLFIILAGILGTSRIILRHHTLGEVFTSFAVGWMCAYLTLDPFMYVMIRSLLGIS